MTRGLDLHSSANIPLAYENPATDTWPPLWDPPSWWAANNSPTRAPGIAWSDGKVIVGFNDGSVLPLPLTSTKGDRAALQPRKDGSPIFPELSFPVRVLNIEMVKR